MRIINFFFLFSKQYLIIGLIISTTSSGCGGDDGDDDNVNNNIDNKTTKTTTTSTQNKSNVVHGERGGRQIDPIDVDSEDINPSQGGHNHVQSSLRPSEDEGRILLGSSRRGRGHGRGRASSDEEMIEEIMHHQPLQEENERLDRLLI